MKRKYAIKMKRKYTSDTESLLLSSGGRGLPADRNLRVSQLMLSAHLLTINYSNLFLFYILYLYFVIHLYKHPRKGIVSCMITHMRKNRWNYAFNEINYRDEASEVEL